MWIRWSVIVADCNRVYGIYMNEKCNDGGVAGVGWGGGGSGAAATSGRA
jgi:hypothetical protein